MACAWWQNGIYKVYLWEKGREREREREREMQREIEKASENLTMEIIQRNSQKIRNSEKKQKKLIKQKR